MGRSTAAGWFRLHGHNTGPEKTNKKNPASTVAAIRSSFNDDDARMMTSICHRVKSMSKHTGTLPGNGIKRKKQIKMEEFRFA